MMFDEPTHTALREPLEQLASQAVYVGTSSWKYPGWCGQVYDESRYVTRGKFSEARFERECLAEYAEIFPTVCVDAGYYKFPSFFLQSGEQAISDHARHLQLDVGLRYS